MELVKKYRIPNVEEPIHKVRFGGRYVEFWSGSESPDKVLIAHDGQCVFNSESAKNQTTWQLAENASLLAQEFETEPPLIIAVWHKGLVGDSVSRGIDLSPEDYFKSGMKLFPKNGPFDVGAVQGNNYLSEIFEEYVPIISSHTKTKATSETTAMIGASRGALSTLYALNKHPDKFSSALAHSTHWPIGREPLVEQTIRGLPAPGRHFIWMSHGTEGFDEEYEPFQNYAHELLLNKGFRREIDFTFRKYPGMGHTEAAWAIQSKDSLRNWFQKIL